MNNLSDMTAVKIGLGRLRRSFLALVLVFGAAHANAVLLTFGGSLDVAQEDNGSAIFSGTPLGTSFSGVIDDVGFFGSISNGTTTVDYTCCIAAGGLSITNNEALDADEAAFFTALTGVAVSAGEQIDVFDIEGDAATASGGRIEVGLSWVFDVATFTDTDPGNYPPSGTVISKLTFANFFIAEFDSQGDEIYSAVGLLDIVPFATAPPTQTPTPPTTPPTPPPTMPPGMTPGVPPVAGVPDSGTLGLLFVSLSLLVLRRSKQERLPLV